jgi:hypothetical protein
MGKIKLSTHVMEQMVLHHQHKMFIDVLERLNLVMELHKNGFGGHLPIHTKTLC